MKLNYITKFQVRREVGSLSERSIKVDQDNKIYGRKKNVGGIQKRWDLKEGLN